MPSGTAYDATGRVQGGMSVDWADQDRDGRLDLFVSTYVHQDKEIYRNQGSGYFRPVGRARLPSTVIGCLVHGAEHAMRHVGQLSVTARIVRTLA